MNASCRDFRTLLENRLALGVAPEGLADLAWHEHLFACAGCRALLESEEALESLLASLPEPRLEPAIRDRVLARLRDARDEERLDSLLDRADTEPVPSGLARRVLATISLRADEERLDRLLDADVLAVPNGLAARTTHALRLARRVETATPLPTRRGRPLAWRIAGFAAAAAGLAAIAWIVRGVAAPREVRPPTVVDAPPLGVERRAANAPDAPVSDEMLAALDVLENWDVLVTEDVETLLSTLPTDAAVLLEDLEEEG